MLSLLIRVFSCSFLVLFCCCAWSFPLSPFASFMVKDGPRSPMFYFMELHSTAAWWAVIVITIVFTHQLLSKYKNLIICFYSSLSCTHSGAKNIRAQKCCTAFKASTKSQPVNHLWAAINDEQSIVNTAMCRRRSACVHYLEGKSTKDKAIQHSILPSSVKLNSDWSEAANKRSVLKHSF